MGSLEDPAVRGDRAVDTYRLLMFAPLIGVVFLGSGLGKVVWDMGGSRGDPCWLTSISAYYYTPARTVFVGGLLAIGLCLLVIEGQSVLEDACLNMAGLLAPVVAIVPMRPDADLFRCGLIDSALSSGVFAPDPNHPDRTEISPWVIEVVKNNTLAYIVTLFVAAAALTWFGYRTAPRIGLEYVGERLTRLKLAIAALVLVGIVGFVLRSRWEGDATDTHFYAAAGMFLCLAVAAADGAWRAWPNRGLAVLYGGVAVGMVGFAFFKLLETWDHRVLVIEFVEIGLFFVFWLVHIVEYWSKAGRAQRSQATFETVGPSVNVEQPPTV